MRSNLIVALTCVATLACTNTSTHSGTVVQLADGVCELAYRCCDTSEAAFVFGPFVTPEDCADRIVRSGELQPGVVLSVVLDAHPSIALPNFAALDRAIEEGRVAVDGAALSECLATLRDTPCNTPLEDPGATPTPLCPRPPDEEEPIDPEDLPCARVFVGNVGQGGVCASGLGGLECQPGFACRTFGALGVEGECVRLGDVDDYCTADAECGEDLYCSLLDGTCQPFRLEGETCAYADRDSLTPDPATQLTKCDEELSCDPITDTCVAPCERGARCFADDECDETQGFSCIAGRCDAPRALGLPCDADDDCVEGLRCGVPPDSPSGLPECIERLPNGSECVDHGTCESGFCDGSSGTCAAAASVGQPCPSGADAQCAGDAACDTSFAFCSGPGDCPDGRECDTVAGQCTPGCVSLLPDGASCLLDDECASSNCVDGICGTPPFANGQACSSGFHCESGFCNLDDDRVCAELPLAIGERCSSGDQCETGLCFGSTEPRCVTGSGEGEPCGAGQTPCDPRSFYCDASLDPPSCGPLRETGAPCEDSTQCRGSCVVRLGRYMCEPAAPPDGAVCDGSEGGGA